MGDTLVNPPGPSRKLGFQRNRQGHHPPEAISQVEHDLGQPAPPP